MPTALTCRSTQYTRNLHGTTCYSTKYTIYKSSDKHVAVHSITNVKLDRCHNFLRHAVNSAAFTPIYFLTSLEDSCFPRQLNGSSLSSARCCSTAVHEMMLSVKTVNNHSKLSFTNVTKLTASARIMVQIYH